MFEKHLHPSQWGRRRAQPHSNKCVKAPLTQMLTKGVDEEDFALAKFSQNQRMVQAKRNKHYQLMVI